MAKKRLDFSDELRRAIEQCGMSRYRIAQLTGVQESTLSRFMAGRPMATDTIDKIAALLGLHIRIEQPRDR
ncbi:MAG TPA: helix-turn-helix transcriptional regulator [Tepidisphaeraceae bacterium]|jgi:transcriptional regulator with XRE-family HTH domain